MMALKHGRGRIAHLETNMMKATKRHAKVPVILALISKLCGDEFIRILTPKWS
jgi:hypothetical protein